MNTIAELRYHAGFDEPVTSSTRSLADVLWQKESAHEALRDVLRILQAVNLEMNGEIPSEGSSHQDGLSRSLAYAVSEIARLLRESASRAPDAARKDELNRAAWRIDTAWAGILAGDIDDLERHVAEEESAREGDLL